MSSLEFIKQMNLVRPAIEQFSDGTMQFSSQNINQQIHDRVALAHQICNYLDTLPDSSTSLTATDSTASPVLSDSSTSPTPPTLPDSPASATSSATPVSPTSSELKLLRQDYFAAVATLLQNPAYRRILFYLPFAELKYAPDDFKIIYLNAWRRLLNVQDVRENFHEGDVYELDARPGGEAEWVVKCAHLLPWLIEAGYLEFWDVYRLVDLNGDNRLLLQSLTETWSILRDWRLFSESELEQLQRLTAKVPPRTASLPLYNSERRIAWLESRNHIPAKPVAPAARLDGPFSPNLISMASELQSIAAQLAPDEIVLVGGSRLKGYGTTESDFDVFRLSDIKAAQNRSNDNYDLTHLLYDSVWLGGSNVTNLSEIQRAHIAAYFSSTTHSLAVERLENDLLQYRLLHKGFTHFFSRTHYATAKYPQIDGDCPFYDDAYRRLATKLYAKYVFIPSMS